TIVVVRDAMPVPSILVLLYDVGDGQERGHTRTTSAYSRRLTYRMPADTAAMARSMAMEITMTFLDAANSPSSRNGQRPNAAADASAAITVSGVDCTIAR